MTWYFFIGLFIAMHTAYLAKSKGRNSMLWSILSFFFPIALIILLFLKDIRSCPHCSESIRQTAIKCPFCHTAVEPIRKFKSNISKEEFDPKQYFEK